MTNASSIAAFPTFESFIVEASRSYRRGSAEYEAHRLIYESRVAEAQKQNSNPRRLWSAGVNDLWDWSEAQLKSLHGYRLSARAASQRSAGSFLESRRGATQEKDLPEEKSYMNLAAAKQIQSQGGCGSCWAVVAATVLSGHSEIHMGIQRTFSTQELVSCVPNPKECGGQGGCTGATVELAYEWVMKNGLAQEYQVPYTGKAGTCGRNASRSIATLAGGDGVNGTSSSGAAAFGMVGWHRLPENKYLPLMTELVNRGTVGISVSADTWNLYSRGIFDSCPKEAIINHAVTLTGYGKEASIAFGSTKYWLIQNSWGRHWGEHGLIRLLRRGEKEDEQYCGWDNEPEMGSGCKGGPPKVWVCGTCGILYDTVVPHFKPQV